MIGKRKAPMHLCLFVILIWIALNSSFCAIADEMAIDITKKCELSASCNNRTVKRITNNEPTSYWDGSIDGTITISLPRNHLAQGVMVTFFSEPIALTVFDKDGSILAKWDDSFYTAWIHFEQLASEFTLARSQAGELKIARLRVLTKGILPDWVQQWQHLEPGESDLLLIVTHPDDDLLWFGGLLPTYAGELGMNIQVAYMVGGQNHTRRIELLDALWHCGVQYYPDIGFFPDKGVYSQKSAYDAWGGEDNVVQHITRIIRKWQPTVVVTQDLNGEYGHIHHKITAAAVVKAVTETAPDPNYDSDSAIEWGSAHPQKLYIHLCPTNQITIDWNQPLYRFDGKTGLTIAREAFKLHKSQQKGKYHVSAKGTLNCCNFGLFYTSVGLDTGIGDLFENVVAHH